ncbi:hypothetical protein QL185_02370 [Cronobacter malonaticus]|uniref:hypothetical protein n=1 Tax=Cronobacter malonaticus TaxID=413503 RepID=UPI0024AD8FDB|nr:hypothetical protein [Cronobacter malonaticus]MDI6458405.1 hypothetical protein [Cronobacter malonaticus]
MGVPYSEHYRLPGMAKLPASVMFSEQLKPLNKMIHVRQLKDDLQQFDQEPSSHPHNTK